MKIQKNVMYTVEEAVEDAEGDDDGNGSDGEQEEA